jgi:hypothetical protein
VNEDEIQKKKAKKHASKRQLTTCFREMLESHIHIPCICIAYHILILPNSNAAKPSTI